MKARFAFLAALGVACAHAPEAPPKPEFHAADYYPLALGNRWTYRAELLGQTREQTIEIQGEVGGYFRDNQGGSVKADAMGVRDQNRYLLRDPIQTGTEWKSTVSVSSLERYRIVDGDFPCEAPAGGFSHCVKVESKNRTPQATLVNVLTFAPHVGIVRIETYAETTKGERIPQAKLVLENFSVK
jgi:hypothetical protein